MLKFVLVVLFAFTVLSPRLSLGDDKNEIHDKIRELQEELEVVLLMPLDQIDEARLNDRMLDIQRLNREITFLKSQTVGDDRFRDLATLPFVSEVVSGSQSVSDSAAEALGRFLQVAVLGNYPQFLPLLKSDSESFVKGARAVGELRLTLAKSKIVPRGMWVKSHVAIRAGALLASENLQASYHEKWRDSFERFNSLLGQSGKDAAFIASRGGEFRDLLLEVLLYADALRQADREDRETATVLEKATRVAVRNYIMKAQKILSWTNLDLGEVVGLLSQQISPMGSEKINNTVKAAVRSVSASDILNQDLAMRRNYPVDFALIYGLPTLMANAGVYFIGHLPFLAWSSTKSLTIGSVLTLVLASEAYFKSHGEVKTYFQISRGLRSCRNALTFL